MGKESDAEGQDRCTGDGTGRVLRRDTSIGNNSRQVFRGKFEAGEEIRSATLTRTRVL